MTKTDSVATPAAEACTQCGVCCRGRSGTVLVSEEDVARWRRVRRLDLIAALVPGHFGCQGLPTAANGDCVYLRHTGEKALCGIYPLRPHVCAIFPAHSTQCVEYRRLGGRD